MQRFPLVLGLALGVMGCEEGPEKLTFSISNGDGSAVEQSRGSLRPSVGEQRLVIELDQAVHWIEIEHCTDTLCKPVGHGDYCMFENADYAWQTAMGDEPKGSFPDELRGAPRIAGSVTYGELPEHAGWQSHAQPLVEGERYGLNVYVHEEAVGHDDSWLDTAAIGCQYFTIQDGQIVPYEPGRDD